MEHHARPLLQVIGYTAHLSRDTEAISCSISTTPHFNLQASLPHSVPPDHDDNHPSNTEPMRKLSSSRTEYHAESESKSTDRTLSGDISIRDFAQDIWRHRMSPVASARPPRTPLHHGGRPKFDHPRKDEPLPCLRATKGLLDMQLDWASSFSHDPGLGWKVGFVSGDWVIWGCDDLLVAYPAVLSASKERLFPGTANITSRRQGHDQGRSEAKRAKHQAEKEPPKLSETRKANWSQFVRPWRRSFHASPPWSGYKDDEIWDLDRWPQARRSISEVQSVILQVLAGDAGTVLVW